MDQALLTLPDAPAQAAKVAPFAAGSEGVVRKSAAGEFCEMD
jgi:hypothetical protein